MFNDICSMGINTKKWETVGLKDKDEATIGNTLDLFIFLFVSTGING